MCAHHPTLDLHQLCCFACFIAERQALPSFVRPVAADVPRSLAAAEPRALSPSQITHRARMLAFLSQSRRAAGAEPTWREACNADPHAAIASGHACP